jgi:DNA polymerase-1
MYLTPTDNHFACDIETDGLLDTVTRIWCVTTINCVTKEEAAFTNSEDFKLWLSDRPKAILVGHNFISFDGVVLNRLWGCKIPIKRMVDTFVLSQLYNPTYAPPKGCRKGGHSLEAWGLRLNYPKGEFDDFTSYSERMLTYCRRDTRLTALLFRRLSERMRAVGFSERGCEIEHLAWNIIQNKQKKNGFPFDYEKAHGLYVTLRAREEELSHDIRKLWPPVLQEVGRYKGRVKKDGSHSAQYLRHLGQYPKLSDSDDNGYTAYDYVSFNLGSPPQRIEKLLALGWKPVNKTKAGNPKVDEDELIAYAELSGREEVRKLATWIVVNSRANMIRTWLDAYDEKTRAIHGRLFIASTLRYRHSNPNSANIPAVRTKKGPSGDEILYGEEGSYSYESRDCWYAGEEGWSLVGIDGTGIQNRCLIHGLIKTVGEDRVRPFKELALEGDVHKRNIDVLGLANKAAAKKFYYTLMMGGGGARLAADQAQFGTKMTAKEGEAKKAALVATIPGFSELISALVEEMEHGGRIKLCDGTPILVPSPHMVIPYLLQGDESRLMKKALILLDEELRQARISQFCLKVADIHDEWQWKVKDEYVEQFIHLALPCFNRAGAFFKYLIPIDGDAKVGKTWACTH